MKKIWTISLIVLVLALIPSAGMAQDCQPEPVYLQGQVDVTYRVEQSAVDIAVVFEQPFQSLSYLFIDAPDGYQNLKQDNFGFTARIPRQSYRGAQTITVIYYAYGYRIAENCGSREVLLSYKVLLPMIVY